MIRRLLREPLLHFLLLGALLFLAYGWLNRAGFAAKDEIVVSQGQVDGLVMQFERVWQRAPTVDERQALIDSWVRDEVFYREGLAMGLEQGDPVVRRRLSQKVQFILDTGADAGPPTDDELQRWLDAHADDYRIAASYSLRQVYVDPARHGGRIDAAIAEARRALDAGQAFAGDPTMLPAEFAGRADEVERVFGPGFEQALRTQPLGGWQGPVRSSYGLHLVELRTRTASRAATLAEARADVVRDFLQARNEGAQESHYRRLRDKYSVRIEEGAASAAPTG